VGGVTNETLAGPVVAYERYRDAFGADEPKGIAIVVRNLRTGRVLHDTAASSSSLEGENFVSIVVTADGAAAWIVETGARLYQVHAVDANGTHALAVGTEIEPRSLALAGSTLYWTQGGKPMSAPLN
jgi:hypothetical protein